MTNDTKPKRVSQRLDLYLRDDVPEEADLLRDYRGMPKQRRAERLREWTLAGHKMSQQEKRGNGSSPTEG